MSKPKKYTKHLLVPMTEKQYGKAINLGYRIGDGSAAAAIRSLVDETTDRGFLRPDFVERAMIKNLKLAESRLVAAQSAYDNILAQNAREAKKSSHSQ